HDAPTVCCVCEDDRSGRLVARVSGGGALNAPWGVAVAPHGFGPFGGDLLVGNFGDGRINAFRRDGVRWVLDGVLRDSHGHPIVLNGLWGIAFGNGGMAAATGELVFASRPHDWRG